jgi:hypothetical protein
MKKTKNIDKKKTVKYKIKKDIRQRPMTATTTIDKLETDYPDKLEPRCSANLSTATSIGELKNKKSEKN